MDKLLSTFNYMFGFETEKKKSKKHKEEEKNQDKILD